MDVSELTADNLITVLADPGRRQKLLDVMDLEHGSYLPITNHYLALAPRSTATADQLHDVVVRLLPDAARYYDLLSGLVFHHNMAEQTLFLMYEKNCCIVKLGHRYEPQRLLELIAAEHRVSEAITTLALHYYSAPEYPIAKFEAFIREHARDPMLRYGLQRRRNLPADKLVVVNEVFGSKEAPH